MPRKPFINSSVYPYHVTSRCINRDWFGESLDNVWETLCDELYLTRYYFNLKIYAFVLMQNHFHLLLGTPDRNLSPAMAYFLKQSSYRITRPLNRINTTWAQRFKRCELNSEHYLKNTYKYIYQNPVRAGIVSRVEDYTYSTLPSLIGKTILTLPLEPDHILFDNVESTLNWLNEPISTNNIAFMNKALRRTHFSLPPVNKRVNPLENDTL